ncbi:hypothetical protein DRP04_11390 [Archaeoglobales archaeon]|nr:MAG: hypothetical protein DRP04_11390 [Archaeoglobales archaeon]
MPVYSIDDITVFVDGVELEGLAADTGVTPKDKDNIKPIQDWAGITRDWAKMNNRDAEGTIALLASSNSNKLLLQLAETKRPVQVVFASKKPEVTSWKKISIDECFFFYPEVKPDKEENILKYDFVGTGFKIEY